MKNDLNVEKKYYSWINGQPVDSIKNLEVLNPANEEVLALIPDLGEIELDQAIEAARIAFDSWSQMVIDDRRTILLRFLNKIREHSDELVHLLTLEHGRPLRYSKWEVDALTESYVPDLLRLNYNHESAINSSIGKVLVRYNPLGVVCAISAWNAPIMLSYLKVISALFTGNTIVLKPSPFTPLSVLRIAELSKGILPDGVMNVITGGDELGPLMTSHSGFQKITFTGSTETGKNIMKSAASRLIPLTLELGGNDAGIILPDADINNIAEELFWRMFVLSGQGCITLKRLYVHQSIYPQLSQLLAEYAATVTVGNGLFHDSLIGPIQNKRQFLRIQKIWTEIQQSGASILYQGDAPKQGYFFPVTILDNPPDQASFVNQEIFGPIRSIFSYENLEDVIQRANNSPYGLGASVWGKDSETLQSVANRLNAGTVWINQHMEVAGDIPFGGIKESGVGVEFGVSGLRAFCNTQVIAEKQ